MDKDEQVAADSNGGVINDGAGESATSLSMKLNSSDEAIDQTEQLKGMVNQLSTMLRQEEVSTEVQDNKLS